MQLLPAPALLPSIRHYLFIRHSFESVQKLRLFSDGSTGLVFSFNSLLQDDRGDRLPATFIYGQIREYKTVYASGITNLIIVVFQPYGMSSLLGIPASELSNQIVELDLILGTASRDLYYQLSDSTDVQSSRQQLDHFFKILLKQAMDRPQPLITAATQWIIQRNGCFTARELMQFTGYEQRQLERKFKEIIGVSPQKMGSIVRLHHFLKEVQQPQYKHGMTPAVYEAGYYDQAHLIREFRKLTGLTPSLYLKQQNRLAVNFLPSPD